MKKAPNMHEVWTVVCLVVLTVGVSYFNGYAHASQNQISSQTRTADAQGDALSEDQEARLSYALGMVLGHQFRDQSLPLNMERYVQGLKDGLTGAETLLSRDEARAAVTALQRELTRKRAARPVATGEPAGIKVAFKLDPRLTRSQYMGDRWVTPPTFTSTLQKGKEITVEAKARAVDAANRPVPVSLQWEPSDPEMVTVRPDKGMAVKIIVKRPGESNLKVVSKSMTKELHIKARHRSGGMQVEISQ